MEYTEYENGLYTENHERGSNVLYFEKIKRNPSLNAKVADDIVPGDLRIRLFSNNFM